MYKFKRKKTEEIQKSSTESKTEEEVSVGTVKMLKKII